jgi:general secretion pathway protein E
MALDEIHDSLPEVTRQYVLLDLAAGTIYVDSNHASDPLIRTWISRQNRSRQAAGEATLAEKRVDARELSELRSTVQQRNKQREDEENQTKVRRHVQDMIYRATEYGASDLHIHVRERETSVEFVVEKECRLAETLTPDEGGMMLRAIIQGLAPTGDATYLPLEFQNAQIPGDKFPGSGLTSIRGIKGPSYGGEIMTLRLQHAGGRRKSRRGDSLPYPRAPAGDYRLPSMGFTEEELSRLDVLMAAPSGIVIVTGPTGSGKTTTIYEMLSEVKRRKPYKHVITIEDPVEIPNESAVQLLVTNARDEETRAAAYRERAKAILRMAPDIIFIGELRDYEVAAAALEMANTGHLVLTTLHVDDVFDWVDRLEDMTSPRGDRLSRKQICNPRRVRGVISQRLLSYLCQHCAIGMVELAGLERRRRVNVERALSALETWGDIGKVQLRGPGCPKCAMSGVADRRAFADVVLTDPEMMKDFREHGAEVARQTYWARKSADKPMLERGIDLVLQGLLDPIALEDAIDLIPRKQEEGRARNRTVAEPAAKVVGLK